MPTYLVQDLFTDTNSTQLTAHTPDIDLKGDGWIDHGSATAAGGANADIQSNQARVTTDNRGAVIPTGHWKVRVTVDYTFGSGDTKASVITNSSGSRYNFMQSRGRENSNDTTIYTVVGGSSTVRVSGSYSFAASTTYEFKVERTSEKLDFFIDGVLNITYGNYEGQNLGNDQHGFYRHADGADDARWENFRVESLHGTDDPSGEVFRDCFNDPDNTQLTAHTPDIDATGNGWERASVDGASLGDSASVQWISSIENVARNTVASRGAMHDAEITDATVRYVWKAQGTSSKGGTLLRWDSSGSNSGFATSHRYSDEDLRIMEEVSGTQIARASTSWSSEGRTGFTAIWASAIGDVYTLTSPKGGEEITYTDADNLYASNTHFGFVRRGGGNENEFVDGFQIFDETVVSGISVPVARHHYDKNIRTR